MTTDIATAIKSALDYLENSSATIPVDVLFDARKHTVKATGDLSAITAAYHDAITSALITFMEGAIVTTPRNAFRRASVNALGDAFETGYQDGGGRLPLHTEALDWLSARLDQELGFIGLLFEQARELRKEEGFDFFAWVNERADGYTASAVSAYNAGKMFAARGQMLTWVYGDTEHCDTCNNLNGQSHRASWYLARDYIPRKPGAAMDCGGYRCQCALLDKDGNEFTL